MKTKFYYSIATNPNDWSEEKQYCVEFNLFKQFAHFCQNLADSMKTEVRGSEKEGYNSKGYYFN